MSLAYLLCLSVGDVALTVFVSLMTLLANILVLKTTVLFGLEVTCCDAFAVLGLFALNAIQRIHGKPAALRAVVVSLVTTVISTPFVASYAVFAKQL